LRLDDATHIGRVIDNPAYAGLCLVDDSFVTAVWEPFIERERWERLRSKRARRVLEVKSQRGAKAGPYLLSGLLRCGVCGRKLIHRSKNKTTNGVYLCCNGGLRIKCRGGAVDTDRAERFVTGAFLVRIRFAYVDRRGDLVQGYDDPRRSWEESPLAERRRLLKAAIDRVVLVPHRPDSPRGARELEIFWTGEKPTDAPLVLLAEQVEPASPKRKVSEGRVDAVRELEVRKRHKAATRQSERAKAYFSSWKVVQDRLAESWVPR
jgi:hypothetical protein